MDQEKPFMVIYQFPSYVHTKCINSSRDRILLLCRLKFRIQIVPNTSRRLQWLKRIQVEEDTVFSTSSDAPHDVNSLTESASRGLSAIKPRLLLRVCPLLPVNVRQEVRKEFESPLDETTRTYLQDTDTKSFLWDG